MKVGELIELLEKEDVDDDIEVQDWEGNCYHINEEEPIGNWQGECLAINFI